MIITKFDPSCVIFVIKNQNRYKHVLRNPMKHTGIPKAQPEKLAREQFICMCWAVCKPITDSFF